MNVGIYSRVSKDKKGEDRSQELQISDGHEFANENKYSFQLYTEKEGTSGTNTERPEFMRMMRDIEKGEIQAVFAYDMSRFERNENDKWILLSTLRKANGYLFTHRDGKINFDRPEIKLQLDIISATNSYFVELTKVKVKDTLNKNVREGRIHSAPPFGFKTGENKKLIINEETADVVKKIFSLCVDGNGGQTIAKYLEDNNIPTPTSYVGGDKLRYRTPNLKFAIEVDKSNLKWNPATINRILKSTLYKGERRWNNEIHQVDAIISAELWNKAQDALRMNKNHSSNNSPHEYLLKGKIICEKCKNGYIGYTQDKRNISVYMCGHKRHHNIISKCDNKRIDKLTIENLIWERVIGNPLLLQVLKDNFEFDDVDESDYEMEMEKILTTIVGLKNGKNKLIGLVARSLITEEELLLQLPTINEEIEELEMKLTEIQQKQLVLSNQTDILSEVSKFQAKFNSIENAPFELRKKLVDIFIDKVYVIYNSVDKLTELKIHLKLNLKYHSLTDEISIDLRKVKQALSEFGKYKKGVLVTHSPRFL